MMSLFRSDINRGGWFSFNSTKSDWKLFYAKKMLDNFFVPSKINKAFGGIDINEELLITKNLNFQNMSGKKVLVIGGGPSSQNLNKSVLEPYDYLITCNHFYKNSFLKKQKMNIVLVGDEVSLSDPEFLEYINQHSPVLGFEHSSRRTTQDIINFKKTYPKAFIFLTRYFSRLGYAARGCVLASCMGASQVDVIGLDGFKTHKHSFENDKKPPNFYSEDKFKQQMKIFCQYIINDLKLNNFNNLSEDSMHSIYGGILKEVKNEKN